MVCIVCGTGQAAGLAQWHATCPSCGYESAALQVAINRRHDVIEHIPDIHAALRACHERLAPGGLLILNLPNSRGFCAIPVLRAFPSDIIVCMFRKRAAVR